MALSHELPIYKEVYRLILLLFEYTSHFSREYKYTLGQDMKRDSIKLVRSIYRANRHINKGQYLEEFHQVYVLGGNSKLVAKIKYQ